MLKKKTYFLPVDILSGFKSPNFRWENMVSIGAEVKLYGAEYIIGTYIFLKYF